MVVFFFFLPLCIPSRLSHRYHPEYVSMHMGFRYSLLIAKLPMKQY